jgi:hypothetical protein
MKKHLTLALSLLLFAGIVFGQTKNLAIKKESSSKNVKESILKSQKTLSLSDVSSTAFQNSSSSNAPKAQWDILYQFNTLAGGSEQAVETDGNFIYTTNWSGAGVFHKYTMTGTWVSDFTIAGATAIRDLAFDGTYFYGASANMSLKKMDFNTGTLVSTITATCTGVTGIRHCAYDPTLNSGAGGFWVGNWTELGAISMTGTQLIAGVTGNADCYGSAYDNWSNPSNPRLLLFQQGGSGVEIHGFDINTLTFSGLAHDAADIPGFTAGTTLAGGLASYEAGGKFILLGNMQQDPNLIFAYELASTAPVASPGPATSLVATPGAAGAMSVSVSWNNPALTVGGATLTELTSVSLYIDAVATPLYTGATPVIGGAESHPSIDLSTYSPGEHTFTVIGTNTAGAGIPATITVWIGPDAPSAPTSALLVNGGSMLAQVSWVAPTTGLHSGYLTGTGITYDVVRYPGAVLVSDNQTGLTFQETLTVGGNYYYTITASNAIGLGGSATTNSVLFGNFLIYEDFEGTFPSASWTTASNVGIWAQAPATVHPAGVAPHSGTNLAYFDSWTCVAGSTADLITPTVDLSAIVGQLDIWVYHESGYPTNDDNIQIKMSTDNGTNWTNLGTPISRYAATAAWTLHTFYVTGGTATTKFNFFATSAYGNDIHIDDITLVEAPSCVPPTSMTTTGITQTGATLGWTPVGTETLWNIELGVSGFTPTGTPTGNSTINSYLASGLTPATSYDFYIQANCGVGSTSTWVGPITFSTACNIINSFPWIESFEGTIFPTPCWTKENLDLGSGWDVITDGITPLPGWTSGTMTIPTGGGTNAAYCTYTTGGTTSNDQWLISPQIAVQANQVLSFQVYWFGHYQDNLDIKVSTTTSTSSSFTTTILSIDTNTLNHDAWKLFTIDINSFAGQNVYFAFNESIADNAADGAFLALDLVTIDIASNISQIKQDNISIYPNPAYTTINIANAINPNVNIYNNLGKLVLSGNKKSFDISNLSQGLYIVKVIDNNVTYTKQINILK